MSLVQTWGLKERDGSFFIVKADGRMTEIPRWAYRFLAWRLK